MGIGEDGFFHLCPIPDTGVAFFPSGPAKAMVDDGTNTDMGGTARSLLKGGVLSRLKNTR